MFIIIIITIIAWCHSRICVLPPRSPICADGLARQKAMTSVSCLFFFCLFLFFLKKGVFCRFLRVNNNIIIMFSSLHCMYVYIHIYIYIHIHIHVLKTKGRDI